MERRGELLRRLRTTLEAQAFIQAAWLEGADAWGRADEYSDIDLWLDVLDGNQLQAFEVVRDVLTSFGPLALQEVRAHPHPQIGQQFMRSSAFSVFQFVDVCVQTHGREVAFTDADPFLPWFDRAQVLRRAVLPPVNRAEEWPALLARRWRWVLVEKALRRGHFLEALATYHSEVLGLLVEALRLIHAPAKRDFGLKHSHFDFPAEVLTRLQDLYARTSPADLREGVHLAGVWLTELEPT